MWARYSILTFALLLNSSAPPPSAEEQTSTVNAARNAALTFSDTLPDFICTQVTRRWEHKPHGPDSLLVSQPTTRMPARTFRLNESEDWKLHDTLTIQLTYFGQKEQYKLLLVNGKQTKQSYESLGGTTSYGDFGSVLGILFQSSSEAKFTWDHWGILNGHPVMVFSFIVDPAHSQWRVGYEAKEITTGFKGLVFIDPEHHQVLKLKVEADQIPKNFPIQRSGVELDYRMQTVGDKDFLLPLKATNWNDTSSLATKNEIEFHRYRKFSTDSKIDFDTPAPLTDNQTKDSTPTNDHFF